MAASNFVRSTVAGAAAGLGAGVVLLIFLGLTGLATGDGFGLGGQLAGYALYGEAIRNAGAGPILVGSLLLLALSVLLFSC